MDRTRRSAVALLLCILVLTPSAAPAAAAPREAPEPVVVDSEAMSWWGYWTALTDADTATARKFLKQNWHRKLGTNIVLTGPHPSLAALSTTLDLAQQRGVGVVLALETVLDRGCAWTRGAYTQADYDAWAVDLAAIADTVDDFPGTVVAIAGFDDMNPKAALCYFAAPGLPSPVSESMRLVAEHFPDVANRGHIWQIAGWETRDALQKNPALLEHSTMLFPYAYHGGFLLGWDRDLVDGCPRKGERPRSQLGDTYAARNVADIAGFVQWVNEQPGHGGTPVVFIANTAQNGFRRLPVFADGISCIFETTFTHLRCLSATDPNGWPAQVRGVIGFAWNSNDTYGGLSWIGASKVPELKRSGRWLATHRESCTFSATSDYEDSGGDQRYWGWRYEQCDVDTTLSALGACTRLPQRVAGAWRTADGTGRIDANLVAPPIDPLIALARRWTAPATGMATISFRLNDAEPSPPCTAIADDGARVAVYVGTQQIWPSSGWQLVKNSPPVDVTIPDVALEAGAQVRFVVQRGTSLPPNGFHFCDATAFAPDIDFTW